MLLFLLYYEERGLKCMKLQCFTHLDKFLVMISLVVDGSQGERIEMMECDL